MGDRFIRGLIAGTIAGIALSISDYISFYIFHFTKIRFIDMAGYLLYSVKPTSAGEIIFAQFGHLLFTAIVGIILAYLLPKIDSKYYMVKLWGFSVLMMLLTYAIGTFYKVPSLEKMAWQTVTSNLISVSIYAIILGELLRWMDRRIKSR